jgi:uncharacterized membrane protein YeaQ/YmgE (transglycosylase-associated protein family)
MEWIWVIIVGAIVGALGRLLNPGRDPMGWIVTILLGVASLLLAEVILDGFWVYVVGVIIAIVLVTVYGRVMAGRTATSP